MQQSNLEIDDQGPGLIQLGKPWQGIASLQIQCVQDVKTRKCALAGRPAEAECKQQIAKWHDFGSWTEGRHTRNVKLSALALRAKMVIRQSTCRIS